MSSEIREPRVFGGLPTRQPALRRVEPVARRPLPIVLVNAVRIAHFQAVRAVLG